MTESKVKIKIGSVEVEYEGTHGYIAEGLPSLIARVIELSGNVQAQPVSMPARQTRGIPLSGTVSSIAAKLQCKTGPDLAIAGAAKLTFVDQQESFSRSSLLESMKSASAYYNGNYSGNLSRILIGLVKEGRLTEVATNQYAVTASERDKLQTQLA